MDKITFESVMEEIKKSLGEARLMDIEEAMSINEAEPPASRAARQAREDARIQAARAASTTSAASGLDNQSDVLPPKRDMTSHAWEKERQQKINTPQTPDAPATKPAITPQQQGALNQKNSTPGARDAAAKPSVSAPAAPVRSKTPVSAADADGGYTDGKAAKPAAAKPPSTPAAPRAPTAPRASAPAAVDPHAKSKAMFGAATGDNDTSSNFFAADAQRQKELAGLKTTPSAPKAATPSAPKTQSSAPKVSAPATSSNLSKVEPGSAAAGARDAAKAPSAPSASRSGIGSDSASTAKQQAAEPKIGNLGKGETGMSNAETRSANMQNVSNDMEKKYKAADDALATKNKENIEDLKKKPQPDLSNVSENFDQFVKKFLKESR
jgi:hypothetical protein